MKTSRVAILLLSASLFACVAPVDAGYIDNINGSAVPLSLITNMNASNVGWYYTPSFSYTLTGIDTVYASVVTTRVTPIITFEIQTERPINGGVVLGHGTFQGDSSTGGKYHVDIEPVQLFAGNTYFIDFKNQLGMGLNFGTWEYDQFGNPAPSGGAVVNLGQWYLDNGDGFATVRTDGYNFASDGRHVGGAEPILNFVGVQVPEVSPGLLAGAAAVASLIVRRRRKTRPNVVPIS
jgi:hypothetical protein